MKRVLNSNSWIIVLALGATIFFGGCAPVKPVTDKKITELPDTYTETFSGEKDSASGPGSSASGSGSSAYGSGASASGMKDSAGPALLTRREFFTDANLLSLIDSAIRNNPDLRQVLQKVTIAKAKVRLSRGAFLPSLDAGLTGAVDKYGKYTMNGVGNFDTNLSPNIDKDQQVPDPATDLFLGLRSSWEIDVWGKLKDKKKAAYARYLASEQGKQWAVTQLVSEVASLYYELLAQDNNMEVIRRNIQLQERAVEIVEAQKEGGRATELAVKQFKAQLLNTQSFGYEVRQAIVAIENNLNLLLGRYPQPVKRSASIIDQTLPQPVQTGIPSGLLTRRADIRQAELELLAGKANVAATRKAFLPSFMLTAYGGVNAFNPALLFSPGSLVYGFAGGLTAPVFNRYQLKVDFAIAGAEQLSAFYAYQKNILQGYTEVVTDLQAIDNHSKRFALKQEESQVLFGAVNTAKDLYLNGAATYLEVISAQKGVLDAELDMISGKKQLFISVIDLYRSLGGGWE